MRRRSSVASQKPSYASERPAAHLLPHCMQHFPCFVSSGGQPWATQRMPSGQGWLCTVLNMGRTAPPEWWSLPTGWLIDHTSADDTCMMVRCRLQGD